MLYLNWGDPPHNGRKMNIDFACLNSIVRESYGQHNKKATLQADRIRRNEGKILKLIVFNSNFGISHGDLAKQIGLDRKNLRPYIKRLIDRKLITRSAGKQGKYFPIADVYRDAVLTANFFSEISMSKLLLREENYVIPEGYGSTHSNSFHPKFTEQSGLERAIFEFSNKIGAFITYILIQAMNLKNKHVINSREKDLDQDALVKEWIENAIVPIISFLPYELKFSLLYHLFSFSESDREKPYDEIRDYIGGKHMFQLNKKIIDEISRAFEGLYPQIKYQLDEILEKLPLAVDNYKVSLDHYHEKVKIQETCKHEYQIVRDTLVELGGSMYRIPVVNKIMHCIKCHSTKFPKSKY